MCELVIVEKGEGGVIVEKGGGWNLTQPREAQGAEEEEPALPNSRFPVFPVLRFPKITSDDRSCLRRQRWAAWALVRACSGWLVVLRALLTGPG